MNKEVFEKKLQGILDKYKGAIESKDGNFVGEFLRECLDREIVLSPRTFKTGKQSTFKCLKNFLVKFLLLIFLFSGLFLYAKETIEKGPSGNEYAKDANYWAYFFRRWSVRLGLNNLVVFKKLYEADCLINNPLASKEPRPCFCGFKLKKYRLNSTAAAQKAFKNKLKAGNLNPFIMLNAMEYPVSYVDLRSLVLGAANDFDSGHSFTSVIAGAGVSANYKHLFADPEQPPPNSIVAWDLNFVAVAHHLRKLFPRPSFVARTQEIHLSRRILLFGASAPSKPVSVGDSKAGSFYFQAWGQRVMALKSPKECGCKSSVLAFHLNQGDLLFFNGDHHDLVAAPTKKSTGYSLGYIGQVGTDVARNA